MKILKKTLVIIITTLLILLLAFNIYNYINLKILKKDLASISGYAVLEVVSGSMEPTIKIGDLVIINTKKNNYKENDIITFHDENGEFVTHRIVKIDGNLITTKGDNNNTSDTPINKEKIIGTYCFKIAALGTILTSLKKPFVCVMILIIGILICFLVSTDKFGNPIDEKEEEEFKKYLEEKNQKNKNKENKDIEKQKIEENQDKGVNKPKKKTPKKNKKRKKRKKRKRNR